MFSLWARFVFSTMGGNVLSWLVTLVLRGLLMILTRTAVKVWDLCPEGTIRCGLYSIRVSKRQQSLSIRRLKTKCVGGPVFSFTGTTRKATVPLRMVASSSRALLGKQSRH